MGNIQTGKSSNAYETAIENLDNESYEGTDKRTQPKVSSAAHLSYFTDVANQIAEERYIFQGSVAEDIQVEPIVSTPWMVPMNSADPLLKQKPPEVQWSVPKMVSPPISISPPFLDTAQKPLDSDIPEVANGSRENNTDGKNKVVGDLIIKEAAAILPPVFEFSYGRFPNESPLYPIGMDSIRTQLSELPTTCSDGNSVTYQIQAEDQGTTGGNPTLKGTNTNATSQGRSMAKSNSTALEDLPIVTQPPNNVLMPLDGSQNIEQTAKAHPLFDSSRGHCSTELPVNTPGIKDEEAEKITHKTSTTLSTTKTNPIKVGSMSISQPSPCNVQTKTQEEMQVKSFVCFSYADALKKSLKVTQQSGAPKPLDKGLIIQQKLDVGRNTTNVEKQAITKPKSWRQNSAQVNLKNPGTDISKNLTTGPPTPPFKTMEAQHRFQWFSPHNNPKDHFHLKGSKIMLKSQIFTPNNPIQVQHTVNFGSTGKPWERTNHQKFGDAKKNKVYQSYPIERRSKPKLVSNMPPTLTLKEPVQRISVVSTQPQDVGLQNHESSLPEKPSRKNNPSADDTLEHPVPTEKSDQTGYGKTPEPMPEVKPQLMAQCETTETKETFVEEHGDTSDLINSSPSVPYIMETTECPDPIDQNPDKPLVVLENETASEPTTSLAAPDTNVSVGKDDPDKAPKHQPSGRWKPFYVDNTCTMKCRCRHHPGKLPPNVVSW